MKTRTHMCGQLRAAEIGRAVRLMGWVQRRRDHGGLVFIDLRDHTGITQVVFNSDINPLAHEQAQPLRNEFVICISGIVSPRPTGMANPNLPTGDIDVMVDCLEILNEAKTPPFMIEDDADITDVLRLKYRYLDLRRPKMQRLLALRHQVTACVRSFLNEQAFLEVETPMLTKSTPEGARDYLVPSRVNPGSFFALPQSPQLFKQILMVAGTDRYYQIARCFRDEDLRFDRQPEFTQIDLEMAFVDREQVMALAEQMISVVFQTTRGISLAIPFPRLSYQKAMDRYGSDKPDLRFDMPLHDLTAFAAHTEFKVFKETVGKGGIVKALIVKGGGSFARSRIDALGETAKAFGAKGLAWVKIASDRQLESVIAKFLNAPALVAALPSAEPGDLVLFGADQPKIVYDVFGRLRLLLAEELNLIDKEAWRPLWVLDFPLLNYDEADKRFVAVHHPFTAPLDEDIGSLESAPVKARAILRGQVYVSCDDVEAVALPIFRHRIIPNFAAQSEGVTSDDITRKILATIPQDER